MRNINTFFIELRANAGAIWVDNDSLKFSAPKTFQTNDVYDFIRNHKAQLLSILKENQVFSQDVFLTTEMMKDSSRTFYPLSPAQERLWFIEQFEDGTNAYHMPIAFVLGNEVVEEGVNYALQQIVKRHEVLRSTIQFDSNHQETIQIVHEKPVEVEKLNYHDSDDYETEISNVLNTPFDLSSQYPVRLFLVTIHSSKEARGTERILVVNTHHIATDGLSIGVFQRELTSHYESYIKNDKSIHLPSLPIQYKEYAVWQKSFLSEETLKHQLAYWKNKLTNYETLKLPVDFPRPSVVDYTGDHVDFEIPVDLTHKLKALAQESNVSINSVMLAAFTILLSKYTGQQDIVTGSPVANRHHEQVENLIGFFINVQANRSQLHDQQSFKELIQKIHVDQMEAQAYQDLPFPKLVEELKIPRDTSAHPIFQVMFEVQSIGGTTENTPHFFSPYQLKGVYEIERYDLSMILTDFNQEMIGHIGFATSLFKKQSIAQMVDHYQLLLQQLVEKPVEPYHQFSLLNQQEYTKIIEEWNSTQKEYPVDETIVQLFEKQVNLVPDKIAVKAQGRSLTYRELNEKSNQLAVEVQRVYFQRTQKELKPDTLIALCLDKSVEMLVGIWAVLKAGAAYVPIDPDYPQNRITFMLADMQTDVILTQKGVVENHSESLPQEKTLFIDLSLELYTRNNKSNIQAYSKGTDLAYVVYTSGTTGRPKGVMVEHQSFAQFIYNFHDLLSPKLDTNTLNTLCLTNYVFDIFGLEYALPLVFGHQVTLTSIDEIQEEALVNHQLIQQTPSTLLQLCLMYPHQLSDITCLVGGEALTPAVAEELLMCFKLVTNVYGPAETVIWSSSYDIVNAEEPFIGTPLYNEQVYVLDQYLQPVPIGVVGELYIGGTGVGRGYLNRDKLTQERFVTNPFVEKGATFNRIYKTGDLVKWLPHGVLQYMGRNDDQIKIRGHRVELGEIEKVMSQLDEIKQSCVLIKEKNGDKYLVGYYVADHQHKELDSAAIQAKLTSLLPDYMIPVSMVSMEAFPLTFNGKLNKRALPEVDFQVKKEKYRAPTTDQERRLCQVWEKILNLEKIGMTDDFFEVGGNSILAIQTAHQMTRVLNTTIKVADVFNDKTIQKILENCSLDTKLVKAINPRSNSMAPAMIFVHPASAGSEVYHEIIEHVTPSFNCYGVDNQNVLFPNKTGDLNELATNYLTEFETQYTFGDTVYLVGWSLGGLIAMEMAAILEAQGKKKIRVFVLDTHLMSFCSPDIITLEQKESSDEHVKQMLRDKGYNEEYIQKVASAVPFETKISMSPLSRKLEYTHVTLFKAMQVLANTYSYEQLGFTYANNLDLMVRSLDIIELDCHHLNLLETNAKPIADFILSDPNEQEFFKENKYQTKQSV